MKNKRIDNISNTMSKRHGIFTENFTIFFQMQEKLEMWHLRHNNQCLGMCFISLQKNAQCFRKLSEVIFNVMF